MIKCKGLCKKFGDKKVLDGLDLEVRKGSIVGLLGPSGAGKTTMIKILTGQLDSTSGSVMVFGKNVKSLTGEDKKKFGIMMDNFGVYERFSCMDNLMIYADIYGVKKATVNKTLDDIGLGDAKRKPASALSKGMKARLRLARAFIHDPEIIFLDEPTSGLDPQSMKSVHKIIMDKKAEGCTIFLTTHNMEEASKLCDEIFLLNEGKIVERGKPEDICRRYNRLKKIRIHLTDGSDMELSAGGESATRISDLLLEGRLETIHSTEPTLETVFLELTGRGLQEAG
ncbi:MAG: ABC transporter ATP-binding protein [Lachnospiraceae bacterium]|nr:ABC transporter ATP-binding protein [Lachnospiraceae bacterium]